MAEPAWTSTRSPGCTGPTMVVSTLASPSAVRTEAAVASGTVTTSASRPSSEQVTQAVPSAHDGRLVLLYHVLWELTHVCFEHSGLLARAEEACAEGTACVTCSDEGLLAEVVAVPDATAASVRTADGEAVIDTTIVGPVHPGDLVLVHAGSAIALLEEADGA